MDFRLPPYPFLSATEFAPLVTSYLTLLRTLRERMEDEASGLGPYIGWARVAEAAVSTFGISVPPPGGTEGIVQGVIDHILDTVGNAATMRFGRGLRGMLSAECRIWILSYVQSHPVDEKIRSEVIGLLIGKGEPK